MRPTRLLGDGDVTRAPRTTGNHVPVPLSINLRQQVHLAGRHVVQILNRPAKLGYLSNQRTRSYVSWGRFYVPGVAGSLMEEIVTNETVADQPQVVVRLALQA